MICSSKNFLAVFLSLFYATVSGIAQEAVIKPELPADSLQNNPKATENGLTLQSADLVDFDYEEFGDWIILMPGFYPYDLGGYGQPFRGQYLGLMPRYLQVSYRERPMTDPLTGSAEMNWIGPGSINHLTFNHGSTEALGEIDAGIRILDPDPPASRIGTRDGYYGLGFVDFDLGEYITPSVQFNAGGRVSTYDGRLPHSAGYGLNLRTEVSWFDSTFAGTDSSGLWGWWGIMQNRRKSDVPYSEDTHNTDRYETDFVLNWRTFSLQSTAIQQRESWNGKNDGWDEVSVSVQKETPIQWLTTDVGIHSSIARWKLYNLAWSSTYTAGGSLKLGWRSAERLKIDAFGRIDHSDDFDLKHQLGVRIDGAVTQEIRAFAGGGSHQNWPSRFETAADFEPGNHFFPYDPAFYQYPDLPVKGNSDLKNETVQSVFGGGGLHGDNFDGEMNLFYHQIDQPIIWQIQDDHILAQNGTSEEYSGAAGWFRWHFLPYFELGGTGSYVPLESGERRIFPELMLHSWVQYRLLLFNDNLDLRFRLWENLWGQRWFPVPDGWEKQPDDSILSGRITARIYGFQIYYGVNNICARKYELMPGYRAMHKEEVWGLVWNFIN